MNETLELALLPFQLAFMQNAFLVTLMIAVPMALLSCYLVLKGWSLMGDAVSHAVLPGVVIAYVVGLPFAAGAFVAGLFCALAAGYLKELDRLRAHLPPDARLQDHDDFVDDLRRTHPKKFGFWSAVPEALR